MMNDEEKQEARKRGREEERKKNLWTKIIRENSCHSWAVLF